MSKAYIKKSHLHKPLKGQGSYDRSREVQHIYEDTLADADLAAHQLAHRSITRKQELRSNVYDETTNGEPDES